MTGPRSTAASDADTWLTTANRFAAPFIGGYVFSYGFVALATLAGFAAGLRYFESESLSIMLAILVFLGALLWGFFPRPALRTWLVLGGGGIVMSVAAYFLSRTVTG